KLTEVVGGELKIVSNPPLIVPIAEFMPQIEAQALEDSIKKLFDEYRQSLMPDRRYLVDEFTYVDSAQKVVGVGSVGTRAWILVMAGRDETDPLVLQLKEAQPSVLEQFAGKSIYKNSGRRVVEGQHLMQASSDVLLGWTHSSDALGVERDYYIRQLWDWKSSIDLETIDEESLAITGRMCGWTLARAHARSGNRFALAGYLGTSDVFEQALVAFASSYADQNEQDY
ncbi:MAG: DUF2252 family protein, partial [Raoultibacter sp.]